MGVSLDIYTATIGLFFFFKLPYAKTCLFTLSFALLCLHFGMLLAIFLLICVAVHVNPGPECSMSLKVGYVNAWSINIPCRANV